MPNGSWWLTPHELHKYHEQLVLESLRTIDCAIRNLLDEGITQKNVEGEKMEREFIVKVSDKELEKFEEDYKPSCEVIRCVNCANRKTPACENKLGSRCDMFFCGKGITKTEA